MNLKNWRCHGHPDTFYKNICEEQKLLLSPSLGAYGSVKPQYLFDLIHLFLLLVAIEMIKHKRWAKLKYIRIDISKKSLYILGQYIMIFEKY